MCFEDEIHKWPILTYCTFKILQIFLNSLGWCSLVSMLTSADTSATQLHGRDITPPPHASVSFSQQTKSRSKSFERKRQHYPPAHYTQISQQCQQSVSKSSAGLGLISSLNISSSFLGLQESQGCSPDGYLSGQLSPTRDVISSWASRLNETQEHARMQSERQKAKRNLNTSKAFFLL